jgi:hypothetical protein
MKMMTRHRGQAPTGRAAVVLASFGPPISMDAVRAAGRAAGEDGPTGEAGVVAVVSIARMHGFALGLPNPGLLPTRAEREAQAELVARATGLLAQEGIDSDGLVVVTRNSTKAIARIARQRGARVVVVQAAHQGRLRALLEGSPVAGLRRKLRGRASVLDFIDPAWHADSERINR